MEKFIIEGLDCAHCAQKLEDKLNKHKNIKCSAFAFLTENGNACRHYGLLLL